MWHSSTAMCPAASYALRVAVYRRQCMKLSQFYLIDSTSRKLHYKATLQQRNYLPSINPRSSSIRETKPDRTDHQQGSSNRLHRLHRHSSMYHSLSRHCNTYKSTQAFALKKQVLYLSGKEDLMIWSQDKRHWEKSSSGSADTKHRHHTADRKEKERQFATCRQHLYVPCIRHTRNRQESTKRIRQYFHLQYSQDTTPNSELFQASLFS